MVPEPRRFSTPIPWILPMMSSSAHRTSAPSCFLVATTVPSGKAWKSSSVRYKYSNPWPGLESSFHATLNRGFRDSTSPIRAPLLQAMYTRGRPLLRAYLEAASKKSSSFTPNDPDCTVTSLATTTTSRPAGYSGVFMKHAHASIPTVLVPTSRTTSSRSTPVTSSRISSLETNTHPSGIWLSGPSFTPAAFNSSTWAPQR
mmetsp:Transcript_36205/g.61395  ORF Transcript_36205/g.61395 Transcript_36205/m.61395 type:complete len:201 (-) Transcript_36205:2215-2817(-)